MCEDYKRAIDIITDENTNWKDIVVALAKANPSQLVEIIDGKESKLGAKIQEAYNSHGFVVAIKAHRELTGSSLKEAKEYVDTVIR